MPKMFEMMQKLKTSEKYSTLSHQPGTSWGHTRNVQELLSGGTFCEKLHLTKYYVQLNILLLKILNISTPTQDTFREH